MIGGIGIARCSNHNALEEYLSLIIDSVPAGKGLEKHEFMKKPEVSR